MIQTPDVGSYPHTPPTNATTQANEELTRNPWCQQQQQQTKRSRTHTQNVARPPNKSWGPHPTQHHGAVTLRLREINTRVPTPAATPNQWTPKTRRVPQKMPHQNIETTRRALQQPQQSLEQRAVAHNPRPSHDKSNDVEQSRYTTEALTLHTQGAQQQVNKTSTSSQHIGRNNSSTRQKIHEARHSPTTTNDIEIHQ